MLVPFKEKREEKKNRKSQKFEHLYSIMKDYEQKMGLIKKAYSFLSLT